MPKILIVNAAKNTRPVVKAKFSSFFMFTVKLIDPYLDEASSAVIRSIIVAIAASMLTSVKSKGGSCISFILSNYGKGLVMYFIQIKFPNDNCFLGCQR